MIAFDDYVTNAAREDIEQLLKEEDESIANFTENMYNFRSSLFRDLLTIMEEETAALDLESWRELEPEITSADGQFRASTTPEPLPMTVSVSYATMFYVAPSDAIVKWTTATDKMGDLGDGLLTLDDLDQALP